jgi:hypothetical protein
VRDTAATAHRLADSTRGLAETVRQRVRTRLEERP